jgi:hypothetical protein
MLGASIPANKPQLTLTVTTELNLFFISKIKRLRGRALALSKSKETVYARADMTRATQLRLIKRRCRAAVGSAAFG